MSNTDAGAIISQEDAFGLCKKIPALRTTPTTTTVLTQA